MSYKVISVVPTVYQVNSLSRLMGGSKQWGGGRFGYEREFETREDAIDWMHERNHLLWMTDYLSLEEYEENGQSIDSHGTMSYDAAYCRVEELV